MIFKLNCGTEIQVDSVDSDLLDFSWRINKGYVVRSAGLGSHVKTLRLHRIILERKLGIKLSSEQEVDHIDRDKLNNCRENLRVATRKQNARNRPIQANNTSGYRGVSFDNAQGKWVATIWVEGGNIKLGRFIDIIDAAKAYNDAAVKYHGEFASLNIL